MSDGSDPYVLNEPVQQPTEELLDNEIYLDGDELELSDEFWEV